MTKAIIIDYTNWRGERTTRKIVPTGKCEFGANAWHTVPQWLLEAVDCRTGEVREFAMCSIHSMHPAPY